MVICNYEDGSLGIKEGNNSSSLLKVLVSVL